MSDCSPGAGNATPLQALLIDPDTAERSTVLELLRSEGFGVIEAADLAAARASLEDTWPDVVISSLALADGSATELLEDLNEALRPAVVVLVDPDEVDAALQGLRHGVTDYLERPIDPRRLHAVVDHVTRTRALVSDLEHARGELRRLGRFGRFVGASRAMGHVYQRIARAAPTDAPVLILGESGTGKDVVAQTLHDLSQRRGAPMCAVNCGAIAPELLESELFGHEKGAFTGASDRFRGWFERADGGTLFLDEITEMPVNSQVNLLRTLETGRVRRLGSEKDIAVDVRILAASNRNIEEAVESGTLREDLYYRLKVVQIWVPPLRDRGGDAELLARFFLSEFNEANGTEIEFSRAALAAIVAYPWPGNVRELRNAVHGAAILVEDQIEVADLPPEVAGVRPREDRGDVLRVAVGTPISEVERRLIFATLEACGGNRTRAAAKLGISVKTLYNRLRAYESKRR